MGAYGVYQITPQTPGETVRVIHGNTELVLEAGRFEPTNEDEAAAVLHLCSVSVQAPGDPVSHVLAALVEPAGAGAATGSAAAPAPAPVAPAPAPAAAAEPVAAPPAAAPPPAAPEAPAAPAEPATGA